MAFSREPRIGVVGRREGWEGIRGRGRRKPGAKEWWKSTLEMEGLVAG